MRIPNVWNGYRNSERQRISDWISILKNGFRYNVPDADGKISSRLCGSFFRAVRRTEERPLAVFVCAKMPEGVCFFSVFFGLEGRRKEKNGNGEILFVSRKERGYGKREYMASSDGLAEADK